MALTPVSLDRPDGKGLAAGTLGLWGYLFHVADNEETMREYGSQAVVWQTAFNPIIALELLATGVWSGTGILGPEAFDAKPFLDLLAAPAPAGYGSPWGIEEKPLA